MATWHDPDSAREQWIDAPLEDETLEELLEVAQDAVLAYAPALDPELDQDEDLPVRYRVAQLMQARNLWNAALVDPSGAAAEEGSAFTITPHPLDWQIKQVLRPRTAKPRVR